MKIDIKHVAKLASLTLSDKEKGKLEKQLNETLAYIDKLEEINTKGVRPTSQVTGIENLTREDDPRPSLPQEKVLGNSKSTHNGLFKIKAILGE